MGYLVGSKKVALSGKEFYAIIHLMKFARLLTAGRCPEMVISRSEGSWVRKKEAEGKTKEEQIVWQ